MNAKPKVDPELEAEIIRWNGGPITKEQRRWTNPHMGECKSPDCTTRALMCVVIIGDRAIGGIYHCEACIERHERWLKRQQALQRRQEYIDLKWLNDKLAIECTFEHSLPSMELPGVYAQAQKWLDKGRYENPYIHGEAGTGKTYLAYCLLNRALLEKCSVRAIHGLHLARMLYDPRTRKDPWKPLRDPSVLLLDDLDKATWKEETLKGLQELQGHRFDRHRLTIVTSNFEPDVLAQQMREKVPGTEGETLVSNIFDRFRPVLLLHMSHTESLRKQRR